MGPSCGDVFLARFTNPNNDGPFASETKTICYHTMSKEKPTLLKKKTDKSLNNQIWKQAEIKKFYKFKVNS